MKLTLATMLFLLLGASATTSELVGSWNATRLGQGNKLAPLGRSHGAVIDGGPGGLLRLVLSGCSSETFLYHVNGAHLTYACGEPGTPLCLASGTSCDFARVNADGTIQRNEEKCTDTLPYCAARLRRDDQLLVTLLRTASSWRYSKDTLTISSSPAHAQVVFERADR